MADNRCVFCRTHNNVRKAPAYCKGGKLIKHSRVFTVSVCDRDAHMAQGSFDNPFTDAHMIELYKESIRGDK